MAPWCVCCISHFPAAAEKKPQKSKNAASGSVGLRPNAAESADKNDHRHVVGNGIFAYIWLIFMVNVGKYTIHGLFGFCFLSANRLFRRRSDMAWFMMIQQFFSNLITFSIRCIRQRRNIRNTKVWLEQKVAFAYIYIHILYIYIVSTLACGFGIDTLINQTFFW